MKVSKLLSIDHELATLLSKEKNASALVNLLLQEYFDTHGEQMEKKNSSTQAGSEANQAENATIQAKTGGKIGGNEEEASVLPISSAEGRESRAMGA